MRGVQRIFPLLATFVAFLSFAAPIRGTYVSFRVDHVCFVEEATVAKEKIVIEYLQKLQGAQEPSDTYISVVMRSLGRNVASYTTPAREGQFSFQADVEGKYDICVARKRAGDMIDLTVNIHVQFDAGRLVQPDAQLVSQRKQIPTLTAGSHITGIDAERRAGDRKQASSQAQELLEVMSFIDVDGQVKETLRSKEYLKDVEERLHNIRLGLIEAEAVADAFVHRHEQFRSTTSSSYTRLFGFTIVIVILMLLLSIYQYLDMKSFLIKKKLV